MEGGALGKRVGHSATEAAGGRASLSRCLVAGQHAEPEETERGPNGVQPAPAAKQRDRLG